MFAKLALLILTIAGAAAAQLSIRHQRLQAVHEMTTAVNQEAQLHRRCQSLRVKVVEAVTPERILAQAEALWELEPIRVDWSSETVTLSANTNLLPLSDGPLEQVAPDPFAPLLRSPLLASPTTTTSETQDDALLSPRRR